MSKKSSKESTKPAPLQDSGEPVNPLRRLRLQPLNPSNPSFDYVSQLTTVQLTFILLQQSKLFNTYLRSTLQNGVANLVQGEILTIQVFGENEQFKVVSVEVAENNTSDQAVQMRKVVGKATQIEVVMVNNEESKDTDESESDAREIEQMMSELRLGNGSDSLTSTSAQLFGGFKTQKELLQEVLQMKLFNKDTSKVKIKGVLLHGPSGIGKTLAIESVLAPYSQLNKLLITPKHLVQNSGNMMKKLQDAFKLAKLRQPSVLVIEEIDFLASSSKGANKEMFYTLLSELDSIEEKHNNVLIIATTNKLDDLDKSLRRGGRLDIDIRFDMPTSEDRYEILKAHLSLLQAEVSIKDEDLIIIARAASGFVSSDLAQIVRNAHLKAIKEQNGSLNLTRQHLEGSIIEAKPLSISDLLVEVPKVRWDEIGGNEDIKFQVRQCVEWPLRYPQKFEAMGLKPPAGIMLYGPPGCSKTMIAKALATESGLNFIAIKGPELFSKYVGDTEKAIREIFRKARLSSPSIIFFDEIDAMATQRGNDDTSVSDRALCQLLNEMDGVESRAQVIVVAATNRLDIIDSALLRPGRFDRLVYVPTPNSQAREQIFKINTIKMQLDTDQNGVLKVDFAKLARDSEGMSGAEICLICREAGLMALTENSNIEKATMDQIFVTQAHLEQSLNEVRMRGKKNQNTLFTNGESTQNGLFKLN